MKKIIATGKGGVGKTTLIATLSRLLSRDGYRVLVIDTDPSMNLAMSMGIPFANISTLAENKLDIRKELDVDDHEDGHEHAHGGDVDIDSILMDYTILTKDKVRVIVMGTIPYGGAGCICSSISLVKLLVEHLAAKSTQYDYIIVDSQAGSEILGRGLATDYDFNLVVTEAAPKAIDVARHVMKLAKDLSIKKEIVVVNKMENSGELAEVAGKLGVDLVNVYPMKYDRKVADADKAAELVLDYAPDSPVIEDIRKIEKAIE